MFVSRVSFCLLLAAALFGAAPQAPHPAVASLAIRDRTNANASLAAGGKFVALAWSATTKDGVTDIYTATSRDAGTTFSEPTRVNTVPGEANVSGEQPPRVLLLRANNGAPEIAVAWTTKATTGTRIVLARSQNGGKTFTPPAAVPGSDEPGSRGWESFGANRNGSMFAIWLDHRELAPKPGSAPMNHAEHQHVTSGENKSDGFARAQLSQLFFAKLDSSSARSIARGVCYCCKTALTTDSDGRLYAAWREVYQGNIRDIAFAMSSDAGRTFTTPVRVSEDDWVLDGCPENGPSIAVDDSKRIHVAWPTLVPGSTPNAPPTLALFYAVSADGRRFTPRLQIPTEGVPRHVQLVLANGQLTAAWDEQAGGTRRIAIARARINSGAPRFIREPVVDSAPASYPVLATADSETILAWTSGPTGQTVIKTKLLR